MGLPHSTKPGIERFIQIYDCKKNMKIIVWGCFWDTGRTGLYLIDRDFESKKYGYSAESYLEVLNAIEVEDLFKKLNSVDLGYEFMHR
jgi:hypothetical protein